MRGDGGWGGGKRLYATSWRFPSQFLGENIFPFPRRGRIMQFITSISCAERFVIVSVVCQKTKIYFSFYF